MKIAAVVSRIVPATVLFVPVLLGSGCNKKVESYDYMVAELLFQKSARMIEVYIDSISQAPDSAAIKNISQNFNIKLTALNYEFPPDTDLRLNEEENDSLIRMHKRFNEAKRKRIYAILHGELNDSLSVSNKDAEANAVQTNVQKDKPVASVQPTTSNNVATPVKQTTQQPATTVVKQTTTEKPDTTQN